MIQSILKEDRDASIWSRLTPLAIKIILGVGLANVSCPPSDTEIKIWLLLEISSEEITDYAFSLKYHCKQQYHFEY